MHLNPDSKVVEAIRRQLLFAEGYCPCAPESFGDADYLCPCKKFREEKECCCQLYVK